MAPGRHQVARSLPVGHDDVHALCLERVEVGRRDAGVGDDKVAGSFRPGRRARPGDVAPHAVGAAPDGADAPRLYGVHDGGAVYTVGSGHSVFTPAP
ncbi:hypothetical protein [Streptomyces sp. MK7]|uniref:hypothetical protein n=1 Tax=Streptomyces sp. MK7 TaxID=3067635 RepID=UPI00292CD0E7|nr:hypothetical protein [Streptomyces sp. MK7]